MVLEKGTEADRYLVLINLTATDHDYRLPASWDFRSTRPRMIFSSDGRRRKWKDTSEEERLTASKVIVPAFGLVILQAGKSRR